MSQADHLTELTSAQRRAVEAAGGNTLVTAGAGSGKTRTLVARYLAELEGGLEPRQVAAITFTEKAAREMRNRIRLATQQRADQARDEQEAARWHQLAAAMEGARIGTIHSLCAEILRNHPAQAVLDPEFEVLEEGTARLLQHEAVEAAVSAAANDPEHVAIFRHYSPWALQRLIFSLLEQRLQVEAAIGAQSGVEEIESWLAGKLTHFVNSHSVTDAIGNLRQLSAEGYFQTQATSTMADMASELLEGWSNLEAKLAASEWVAAARQLFRLRRSAMRKGVGRQDGPARMALDQLQDAYEEQINPWLGGGNSKDEAPDPELEAEFGQVLELVRWTFNAALSAYQHELSRRASLDFDGLEAGAMELLSKPQVRATWQGRIERVLVDEYQDTNRRQRSILTALTEDAPGKLFVVGDARQSIYRFRGADVTIIQELQEELENEGVKVRLDRTFRQHPALLAIFDEILPGIMGGQEPAEPFRVAYSRLESDRESPAPATRPPYLEFLIGLGPRADDARPVAAAVLAGRLLEMRRQGELSSWDQVALLFRASTGFSSYEDALSMAGIPYVTVAGRGFYERPEIREVLNTLRALAEPWNQAAMVGLLRSAAIAMSDPAIFQLRLGPDGPRPLQQALYDESIRLSAPDELARARACEALEYFSDKVDRLPVAELLKMWMDWADARALLAIAGERHWANLDKLLVDARQSGTTRVRAFLEYLRLTQQAGVREGEAPAETSGAVRLMTIHKAKGLEFPYVVLADAGYQRRGFSPAFLVEDEVGLAFQPDLWQGSSLRYRYARVLDSTKEAAEEDRLLYVALTRAQEKVLISGHASNARSGGFKLSGWLSQLAEAAGLEQLTTSTGDLGTADVGVRVEQEAPVLDPWLEDIEQDAPPSSSSSRPLFSAIEQKPSESTDNDYDEPPARAWRASGRRLPPAAVVGVLVHRAIERWRFPPDEALLPLLKVSAIGEGLVESRSQQAAIDQALELLSRFKAHPLYQRINSSSEKFHEVPYTYLPGNALPDSGAIDLLFRVEGGWRLVDFKTDDLKDEAMLEQAVQVYNDQIKRYQLAATKLLEEPVHSAIVFLDAMGGIRIVEHTEMEGG